VSKLGGVQKPFVPTEIMEKLPVEVQVYIDYLEQRLADLENKLAQNSQNSSKPPSSDPPAAPVRPPKKTSGKARGGQLGHKQHLRRLELSEKVTVEREYYPSQCSNPKCLAQLSYRDQIGEPIRHQVWEIVRSPIQVSEHRYYRCECPCCQTETKASRPEGVPVGNFGVELVAVVAVLHGRYRLSMGEIVAVLQALWGLKLSSAMVAKMCQQTSTALAPPYTEAHQTLKESGSANVDETSWKLGRAKH